MEDVVFKLYKLELSTGVITETNREFESALEAKDKCFELNVTTTDDPNNIRYFYFYAYYMDFASFRSQGDLKTFSLEKLKAWNDEINKLKALYMVAKKSLLKGGLNKEAV